MATTASQPPANFANVAAAASSRPKHPQNGPSAAQQPRPSAGVTRDLSSSNKHAHDRLLFLAANFVGLEATVTLHNGDRYIGIFSGASLETAADSHYVLKMVRKLPPADQAQPNGTASPPNEYLGQGDDHALSFDAKDVVDLFVSAVSTDKVSVKQPNGAPLGFRTDADISGNLSNKERLLQRWEPDATGGPALSLNGSGSAAWDQFEANERLYGVKTDYDESYYTTTIDKSNPSYKDRAAFADRIAREIEGSTATSAHIAEERGIDNADEDGLDEEDKYSGVRRDPLVAGLSQSQSQSRYTPPARRAPTGQATVRGAPVDPAIISAQLMQPDSVSKKENVTPTTTSFDDSHTSQANSKAEQASNQQDGIVSKLIAGAKSPSATSDTAPTFEKDVLKSFKDFSALERQRIQERDRQRKLRERQVKLNDFRKFSQNFKLNSEVPQDMLGILAKDSDKQAEIVEKARREVEDQQTTKKSVAPSSSSTPSSDHSPTKQAASSSNTAAGPNRSARPAQPIPQGPNATRGQNNARPAPGHLGERLIANQQRNRAFQNQAGQPGQPQDMRMPPPAPLSVASTTNADAGSSKSPSGSGLTTPTSVSTRFNAQAIEFRPNPAAVSFSPTRSAARPAASPAKSSSSVVPPNRKASFFGDKRPSGNKKSISDNFNPILRMKAEVEKEGKAKEFASNGGIPQAYRTPPTWDIPEKNKDKSYVDVLEKSHPNAPMIVSGTGPMPHQHQLPPNMQQHPGQFPMHPQNPQQLPHHPYPQFAPGPGGQGMMEDQRMQLSMSNSSMYPSPRFQQGMMMPSPMMAAGQPHYSPAAHQMMPPNAQQMGFVRQMSNNNLMRSPSQMAPMMMTNHPGQAPYMGMPMQNPMPMMSPGPQPVMPQGVGPQTPGMPNGYPSPRPGAPMMMPSGSQQGQFMYPSPGQPGQHMYPQHQHQQMNMRPGMPMPQGSYGSSPHFPGQYRQHSHGPAPYGQQMPPGAHGMHPNSRPTSGPNDDGGK